MLYSLLEVIFVACILILQPLSTKSVVQSENLRVSTAQCTMDKSRSSQRELHEISMLYQDPDDWLISAWLSWSEYSWRGHENWRIPFWPVWAWPSGHRTGSGSPIGRTGAFFAPMVPHPVSTTLYYCTSVPHSNPNFSNRLPHRMSSCGICWAFKRLVAHSLTQKCRVGAGSQRHLLIIWYCPI